MTAASNGSDTAEAGTEHAAPDSVGPDAVHPDLAESLRQLGTTGRASVGAAAEAAKAFRTLFAADVSLARSAFGRTLALTGVAIAFGASFCLLLMAATVVFLTSHFGLSWGWALLICAGVSGALAALATWRADRYFEHTRLQATRRQLARLGIGELADFTPTPGSPASTRAATQAAAIRQSDGAPLKDHRGIDVTPP